jgi:hypothetical protein
MRDLALLAIKLVSVCVSVLKRFRTVVLYCIVSCCIVAEENRWGCVVDELFKSCWKDVRVCFGGRRKKEVLRSFPVSLLVNGNRVPRGARKIAAICRRPSSLPSSLQRRVFFSTAILVIIVLACLR